MPKSEKVNIAAQLKELQRVFILNLEKEIKYILNIISADDVNTISDKKTLDDLQYRFHKMAGSGGTFGLPALTEHAREVEYQIINTKNNPAQENIDLLNILLHSKLEKIKKIILKPDNVSFYGFDIDSNKLKSQQDNKHICLIEDDKHLGEHLKIQLDSFGYYTSLFSSIAEAENQLGQKIPDLLISDIMLGADNANSTEILLQNKPALFCNQCPIIFITQYDSFDNRVRAARLGAQAYYLKPLDIPMLVNRITDIFEQKTQTAGKVLIVDDNKQLALNYQLVLQGVGVKSAILENNRNIVDTVMNFRPDLVLMDLHMPDYSGTELASVLRQYDNLSSLSIVFLSAEQDIETRLDAINKGADDFLTKPISNAHLISAVTYRIKRSRYIKEKISRDSLTGLMKHSSIKEAGNIEVMRAQRSKKATGLVILDIDHFKQVNDSYGHATGDVVINSLAILLRQRLRQTDIIGRYGGEEFLVILPECENEHVFTIIDDIRKAFSNVNFNYQGNKFNCSLSAGISNSISFPEMNADELIIKADEALYKAKNAGRNQVKAAT